MITQYLELSAAKEICVELSTKRGRDSIHSAGGNAIGRNHSKLFDEEEKDFGQPVRREG